MASSTVTMPRKSTEVVDDGQRQQVVLGDDARDFVVRVVVQATTDQLAVHDAADGRVRVGDDQLAQRQVAEQVLVLVDDVHVIDVVHLGRLLPDQADGLFGGDGRRHGDDVVGHQAAGRIVVVGQQLANVLGVFGLHAAQEVLRAFGLEVAEDVGGVVGLHLFEDVGRALGLHAADRAPPAGRG